MKFYRRATVIIGMLALVILMVCSLTNSVLAEDLSISTTSIKANTIIDNPYTQTITAVGGTGSYTFSWAASGNSNSLPPGLDIDGASGEISGTLTATGSYTFKVTVTDSSNPQLEASQDYTLTVHEPIPTFTPAPQKFCTNDPISINLSLPNGIAPSGTPYAVVYQVNTGSEPVGTGLGIAELTAAASQGAFNASWSKCLSNPGDYMVLVFDGMPTQGSWPIACGYFAVIIPQVEVTNEVWSDYSNYFRLDLSEYNDDNLDVWSGSDTISLKIYRLIESGGTVTRTLAGKVNNNIDIWDDGISFLLPSGLTAGDYEIDIINNSSVIARADFTINLQSLSVNPNTVYSDYTYNTKIVLYKPDGNEGIWYPRETGLGIQIVNQDDNSTKSINLPSSAVGGDSIIFDLPVGLGPAPYKINLLRAANVIASCDFSIEVHTVIINPSALTTETISFELKESDADLWSADSNITLELYKGSPATNSTNPVDSSLYSISGKTDSTITVNIPDKLLKDEYALFIRKDGMYIGGVRFGVFPPTVQAIIDFNGETSLTEGYEGVVAGSLTEPVGSEALWSGSDSLSLVLFRRTSVVFSPSNLEFKGYLNATFGDSEVTFTLPAGLRRGSYMVALVKDDANTIAHAFFLVKPDPIQLQVGPDETNPDYNSDMIMKLYLYNETASWSVNDSLGVKLFLLSANGETDISRYNPSEIISLEEDCIYVSIPEGLPIGSYRYSIESKLGRIAFGDFKVSPIYLNTRPYEFEWDGTATNIKLYKGGELWTGEVGSLNYSILKWVNGSQKDIGFNHLPVQLVNGSLTVDLPAMTASSLPDNRLFGGYSFIIYDAEMEYAHADLEILPSIRRLEGGKVHIPSSADGVIVPINGYHLADVGGIEFRMYYDNSVVAITQINNTACIPDTTLISSINSELGYADITILPTVAGTVFGTYSGPVCKIGFNGLGEDYSDTELRFEPIPSDTYNKPLFVDAGGNRLNEWNTSSGYIDIRRCGDINFNDNVEIGDAVLIMRHAAGLTPIGDNKVNIANVDGNVDTNGKAIVDANDAILVLKRIVNLIPCFPIEGNNVIN